MESFFSKPYLQLWIFLLKRLEFQIALWYNIPKNRACLNFRNPVFSAKMTDSIQNDWFIVFFIEKKEEFAFSKGAYTATPRRLTGIGGISFSGHGGERKNTIKTPVYW